MLNKYTAIEFVAFMLTVFLTAIAFWMIGEFCFMNNIMAWYQFYMSVGIVNTLECLMV